MNVKMFSVGSKVAVIEIADWTKVESAMVLENAKTA